MKEEKEVFSSVVVKLIFSERETGRIYCYFFFCFSLYFYVLVTCGRPSWSPPPRPTHVQLYCIILHHKLSNMRLDVLAGRMLMFWWSTRKRFCLKCYKNRNEKAIRSARSPRSLWCVATSSIKARGECQERTVQRRHRWCHVISHLLTTSQPQANSVSLIIYTYSIAHYSYMLGSCNDCNTCVEWCTVSTIIRTFCPLILS